MSSWQCMESVVQLTLRLETTLFAECRVANESESLSRKPHCQMHLFNAGTSKISGLFQVTFNLSAVMLTLIPST